MANEYAVHAQRAGRKEWIGLTVLLLPLLFVSMDVSVLYFAVPYLSVELEPTSIQQLWIFDIYGFVLAGLLITMGALGDRIGRRRLLLIGAVGFSAASLLAAYAPSAETLIVARAILGVAGATLMPSTGGLIRNMFHDARQRGTAIGIWSGVMGAGIALGPLISGVLLEHFWWGSVFLINLPFMVLLLVLAPVFVPEFRHPGVGRFDWLSALLSLLTLLPVIWGIKELAQRGGGAAGGLSLPIAAIVVGVLIGSVFVRRQRHRADPILDLTLLCTRAFGGAIALSIVAMFGVVGFALFTTQYLQSVLGLSPLRAALWSVAPSVLVGAVAPLATLLARMIDRAYLMAIGFVVATAGFLVMTQVTADSGLWLVLLAASLYACGLVFVIALISEVALGAAPPERAGSAAALLESGSELGGALGMALLGSIGSAVYRHSIDASVSSGQTGSAGELRPALDQIRETLGGARAVAAHLPTEAGDTLLHLARAAFTDGMRIAALTAAGVMICAAVAALVLLRGIRLTPAPPLTADAELNASTDVNAGAELNAGADMDAVTGEVRASAPEVTAGRAVSE